ncbi:MAG: hypothetical protein M1405_02590 [Patescibacteria group bacterium]|nr:hypothetical protein [Patescibacteria group bacterium]
MKKKPVRKKASRSSNSYTRYLIIGFVIAATLFIAVVSYQSLKNANVLGTSAFLAKDGISGDSGGGSGTSGGTSGGGSDTSKPPEQNNNTTSSSNPQPVGTKTPEPIEIHTPEPRIIKPQLNSVINPPSQRVEIQTENHKSEINAAAEGTHLEIKTEDNGSVSVKAKKADGTEVELETHALDDINEALEEEDIEIGTTSARGFSITNKETKAETEFPVSVNLASRTLSVTTPLGQKDLTVLPNQAVQNVLDQKIIDRVSESSTSTSGAELQLVQLRLFANNPVFQVQGIDDKKLFGVLPVAVQKTTLVSAETGQVVRTNTDPINTLLNLLSIQ